MYKVQSSLLCVDCCPGLRYTMQVCRAQLPATWSQKCWASMHGPIRVQHLKCNQGVPGCNWQTWLFCKTECCQPANSFVANSFLFSLKRSTFFVASCNIGVGSPPSQLSVSPTFCSRQRLAPFLPSPAQLSSNRSSLHYHTMSPDILIFKPTSALCLTNGFSGTQRSCKNSSTSCSSPRVPHVSHHQTTPLHHYSRNTSFLFLIPLQ